MIAVQTGEPALKVLQWNTLADQLATDFPRANVEALQWEQRQGLLIAELESSEADLLVLEEVDHYEDWFLPSLQRLGYEGRFQRKARQERETKAREVRWSMVMGTRGASIAQVEVKGNDLLEYGPIRGASAP